MLKKINKVQLCIALLLLFTLGGGLVGCSKKNIDVAGKDEKVIVNLAGGSDCGYPSIYTHFTRGPGSFKMELVFDSLLCPLC